MPQRHASGLCSDELPDDLVLDEIDEIITHRFENGEYEDDDDLDDRSLEQLLADKDLRLKTFCEIMDLPPTP